MPIYEYRCAACGHHLEALQKMSEGALRKCPECGKLKLARLVSASRFRLKGSGWYETDFKNDGDKKRNLVEQAADSGDAAVSSDAKDAPKPDAKPAAAESAKDGGAAPAKPAADKPAPDARKKPIKPKAAKSART
jgi:putative FmdB family regulatory protein